MLLSHPLRADSFFMNEEQSKLMNDIVEGKEVKKIATGIDKQMKLSCIFYIDEEHWTVWINGKQYSEAGQNEDFCIDTVNEDCVILTLFDGKIANLTVSDEVEHNNKDKQEVKTQYKP